MSFGANVWKRVAQYVHACDAGDYALCLDLSSLVFDYAAILLGANDPIKRIPRNSYEYIIHQIVYLNSRQYWHVDVAKRRSSHQWEASIMLQWNYEMEDRAYSVTVQKLLALSFSRIYMDAVVVGL